MDIGKLFAGIGNTVGNIATSIGNDFSQGVQNFQNEANRLLAPGQPQGQQAPPQQNPLQGQSVPLFVKPQQPTQQQNQLPGPLLPQVQEPQQQNPLSAVTNQIPQLPQQQPNEQDTLNQTLNVLESTARSIVNGITGFAQQQGSNFLQGKNMLGQQMPYNPVNNPFGQAPNIDLTDQINTGNPVTDFAAKTLVGIPQSIVDAPYDEQQALKQTVSDIGGGQITQPNVALSDVARVGLPIATIATLPEGGSAIESLGQQGFKEALLQGGLQGAKYGAGFGLGGAVAGNRNVTDPYQYADNLIAGTAQGAGVGAVLGGGLGGGSRLVQGRSIPVNDFNQYGQLFSTPEGQQAMFGKIQQAAQDQPDFQGALENVAGGMQGRAISNVKTPTSIIGKYIDHQKAGESGYGLDDISDVLRGSIVMPARRSLNSTVQAIKDEAQQRGWQLIPDQEENFFKKPGPNGYEGYHVGVQLPSGTKAEIQIHTPESYANARITHDQYSQYGDQVPKPLKKQMTRVQGAIDKANPTTVREATSAKEAEDLPNTLSPMSTDFAQPETTTGSPRLNVLNQQRDSLQAARQEPTEATPDIQAMTAQRDNIGQQIDAAKSLQAKGTPSGTRIAIRKQTKALQTQYDALDGQIKDLQARHTQNVTEQNARIDDATKDVEGQIADEQDRVNAQDAIQKKLGAQSFESGEPIQTAEGAWNRFASLIRQPIDSVWGNNTFGARLRGNKAADEQIARTTRQQFEQEVPNASDRIKIWDALSDPQVRATLTPEQEQVMQNLKQNVFDPAAEIRQKYDPSFKPIEKDYAPVVTKSKLSDVTNPRLRATLSKFSRENIHRNIWSFHPLLQGEDNQIGNPKSLGMTQRGDGLWQDKNGDIYQMRPATRSEYASQGVQLEDNASKMLQDYVRSTLRFRRNAGMLQAMKSGKYGIMATSRKTPGYIAGAEVDPGLRGVYLDKRLAASIKASQSEETTNPFSKAAQSTSRFIRDTLLTNVVRHPLNQEINSLIGSGNLGPKGTLKFAENQGWAEDAVRNKTDDYLNAQRMGIGLGGLGHNEGKGLFETSADAIFKDSVLNKGAAQIDKFNPLRRFSQINHAVAGHVDDVVRMSLYKTAVDGGRTPEEAAGLVRTFLTDYGDIGGYQSDVVNNFDKILSKTGLFYPYFKGETKALLSMARAPRQNAGALVMTAGLIATQMAADKAFQQWSGNQQATLPHFGIPALAEDYGQAPGQIAQSEIPSVLTNHINPLLAEGVNQVSNTAYLPDITNPNKQPIVSTTTANPLQARLSHAAQIIGPESTLASGMAGKKAPGEIASKFLLGTSTPHLQGFSAMPNQPKANFLGIPGLPMNTQGAQQNTGLGIISAEDAAKAKLTDAQRTTLTQIQQWEASSDPSTYTQVDQAYLSDFGQGSTSNLWNVKTQVAKADAQAYGMPVEPMYNLPPASAKSYLAWDAADGQQKLALEQANPDGTVGVERAQSLWEQDPKVQAYKQAIANQYGQTYVPPVANGLYANSSSGKPIFSNQDIVAKNQIAYYESQNPPQTAAADELKAQYPYVQMELAQQPYEAQKLQASYSSWATKNPGANWQDFATQYQQTNGYAPNMSGVSPNGEVLASYDIRTEPPYQLFLGTIPAQYGVPQPQTPQQANSMSTAANLYTAMSKNGLTSVQVGGQTVTKKGLEASNSWLPGYWNYETAYYTANPYNSTTAGSLLSGTSGNGINFGTGSSGGSSSGYSSSSSSSMSYLQRELVYQAMAEARSRIAVPKVPLDTGFKTLAAIQQKLPNFNLAAGPRGQSIFASAPRLSIQSMPKLKTVSFGKGLGRLNASPGPKPPSTPASPGRQTQLKIPT